MTARLRTLADRAFRVRVNGAEDNAEDSAAPDKHLGAIP